MKNTTLERIKKLLRLAKNDGSTPGEAAAALNKAIELAMASGIDLQEVNVEDLQTSDLHHATEPSQAGPAHKLASWIVKRHFGVATLFDSTGTKPVIHFIGQEDNCHLAQYCYVYLVRSMCSAWRTRANRRLRDRKSFLHGYAQAIDRLMPDAFHRPGLILSADHYIETVILAGKSGVSIKKMGSKKPLKLSDKAFSHGHRAGSEAGIRNAIRGTDHPLLPLNK